MPNTACLTTVPFALTGNSVSGSRDVSFQLTFDSTADQASVKAFEWYLDGSLVLAQNQPAFGGEVSCGSHVVGARILTADGWSGVKSLSFQTCVVAVGVAYTLAEQPDPYVDVNMQFKDQVSGTVLKDVYASESGSFGLASLDRFSIEVVAGVTSALSGASIYLRVKKNGTQVFEGTKPAVADPLDPDASIIFLDTPAPEDSYEVLGASYSNPVINYTLSEQLDPFVDANLQIKSGDTILAEVVFSGSGSVTAAYDESLTFTASVGIESTGINPVMDMVVKRNGALINEESIQAHIGDTITYIEAAPVPGATYEVILTTHSD